MSDMPDLPNSKNEQPLEQQPENGDSIKLDSIDIKTQVVAGIGASAGGLEALQGVFSNMPVDTGVSFLVAQHLSPSYKSRMVSLLEKDSAIPVYTAENGVKLKANSVYICPPNCDMEIDINDCIQLITYEDERQRPRPSADLLLESIAKVKGENAIGIILSGTGNDGSRGVRAVKEQNGLVIVQSPDNAKFDSMPTEAIKSSTADLIVSANDIGSELANFMTFRESHFSSGAHLVPRSVYANIIKILKARCGVDFSHYKDNTIIRRIQRRMAALKITRGIDYQKFLDESNDEAKFLFNDMLIGVTSFFRDPKAFNTLSKEFAAYLKNKKDNIIRVWSVGCSTGEEAYSIAMIVHGILGQAANRYKIQIFATDIDQRAIDQARYGRYPETSIKHVPEELHRQFLSVNKGQYEVIKKIKSDVIFSKHDLSRDPPFLRLDLICCRNLMIYFNTELQRQVLSMFHYALNPRALLMLGQSESVGSFQDSFKPLSTSQKLYSSVFVGKTFFPQKAAWMRSPSSIAESEVISTVGGKLLPRRSELHYSKILTEKLREILLPNAILLNENHDIVFVQGHNQVLQRPQGQPSNNIYKNLGPQLSVDFRAAMHRVELGENLADTGFKLVNINGEDAWVRLLIATIERNDPVSPLFAVYTQVERLENMPSAGSPKDGVSQLSEEQERILERTREQLQDVIEELEASNEEMQSMNEELQSSNEELQSSNEELETTNEELQSTNEELQTAYTELRIAYDEKEKQQEKLESVKRELRQTVSLLREAERIGRTGSWMWDIETKIMQWSDGCFELLNLDRDTFHPSVEAFIGVAHPNDRNSLENFLKGLSKPGSTTSFTFRTQGDSDKYKLLILDAVVSFNDFKQGVKVMGRMTDITAQTRYEADRKSYSNKINFILSSNLSASFIYDIHEDNIEFANTSFFKVLGISADQQVPKLFDILHTKERQSFTKLLEKIQKGSIENSYPVSFSVILGDDSVVDMHANIAPYEMNENNEEITKILITFFPSE